MGALFRYDAITEHSQVSYPYRAHTVPAPYPYPKHVRTHRTRTKKQVPTSRTVPNPLGMYTVSRDAQIEDIDFIFFK